MKFTWEIEKNKIISFSDVNLQKSEDRLHSAIHVKSTYSCYFELRRYRP